jgi:YggT family protein
MIFIANFLLAVVKILHLLMMVYVWVIIIRAFLSWIPVPSLYPLAVVLVRLTEPVLRPVRKILPHYRTGGLDLSPMLVVVLILFVDSFLLKSLSLYAAQILRRATGVF